MFIKRTSFASETYAVSEKTLEKIRNVLEKYVDCLITKDTDAMSVLIANSANIDSRFAKKIISKKLFLSLLSNNRPGRRDDLLFSNIKVKECSAYYSCIGLLSKAKEIELGFIYLYEVRLNKNTFKIIGTRYL